ncbi:hypothetical protein B1H18_17355 [Streptomyces tsukubensis]|uniref:histidine kinase n=1 Tax=Streptomyces tsukubensis TaxID=83656 RepID=A0A1V4A7T4_9ACTN|nr:hypothetical protein B1H18_17355 [Streptomyces tsukubensis]
MVGFAGAVVLVARTRVGPALLLGVLAVLVLVALETLRRGHRAALAEADRRAEEVHELEELAARRDTEWRMYTGGQADLVRQELEHILKERLPVAVRGGDIPEARAQSRELAAPLGELFDRLLNEVAEEMEYREESQRLVLVELASRVQTSAHRIQAAATALAHRCPGDADLLDATMQVDHAATQQARHAQSLKVLCGEWPGQQWQKPLSLVDVARAASGRIVAYRRVEVTGEPDIGVVAPLVEPLIHLIAELLANATEYSPPRTTVPVTVRTVQRGAVVEVDDGGLGLDEYRLSGAREIVSGRRLMSVSDVGEIPQTGFAVVGRFAERHGFQVDLLPSPYGGVRAVVLVPVEALEALDPVGARPRRSGAIPRPAGPPEELDAPASRGGAIGPPRQDAPGEEYQGGQAPVSGRTPTSAQPKDGAATWSTDPQQPWSAGPQQSWAPDPSDPWGPARPDPWQPERAQPWSPADPGATPSPVGDGGYAAGAAASRQTYSSEPWLTDSATSHGTDVSQPWTEVSADRGADPRDPESTEQDHADGRGAHARRLPQRHSRRGERLPGYAEPPVEAVPSATPDEAGDWMGQFFEGGRSFPSSDLLPYEGHGPSTTPPDPSQGHT